METISNATVTKCQRCGEWTNYADDPHHKAREACIAELQAQVAALTEDNDNMADRDVAKAAYRLADAMLAEDEKS